MFYSKNQIEALSKELFENPTSEYRGTPFWSWNCKMTKELIDSTLSELKEMGMGGTHFHCRTGLETPYLGEEFMDLVAYGVEKSKEEDMLVWLYDEDRWPSGAGGGYVTREHQYRNRFLVFAPYSLENKEVLATYTTTAKAVRSSERTLLGRYGILLEDGYLKDYCMAKEDEKLPSGYDEWFAYLEVSGDHPWFNNEAYLNTLDKKAVERFIQVTHERYYQKVGNEFGKTIPAIFTDEPQFSHKNRLGFAEEKKEVIIPFTDDLEETFKDTYGHSLLESLPEVFWELPDNKISVTRYQYHDHICERFTEAFADTVGKWCKEHSIMLTGHMMYEPTLLMQTSALGEAMRSYRAFDIPGIDLLCDRRELSTAKQAQSAARQYGKEGVLSELYGVTNWDFDFRGHKLQGDWQAALGITVRVPHLTWTSMAGEAKRDYPAAIGYQSPWYREYKFLEDYFARINTAMTRGKAVCKIGVIHPIESYWLYWGTEEKTSTMRQELEKNFASLIDWLLFGLQDFDFIAESLLKEQTTLTDLTGSKFIVGEMAYDVIIVPNCITLRQTTLERLVKFRENGGRVIFTGILPNLIDASPNPHIQSFMNTCECIPFQANDLMRALEAYRLVDVQDDLGIRTNNLIYQMREDHNDKWLFFSHVNKMSNPDLPKEEKNQITIKGLWQVDCYDALTGKITPEDVTYQKGSTTLKKSLYEHDSLLLRLKPAPETERDKTLEERKAEMICESICLPALCDYELSEPNVYLLDLAEYRFDDGAWQNEEEVLRIDNKYRKKLGYPLRMEAFAQPWVNTKEEAYNHTLSLRFKISSTYEVVGTKLALEDAEDVTIYLNGEKVTAKPDGWYTDRVIKTVSLPNLKEGENELIAQIPYNSKRNIEAMYLLGDFGVSIAGRIAQIIKPYEKLAFGDIVGQGLPFYGGNITYHMKVNLPAGKLSLQATRFRCPLIKVHVDKEEKGVIAFSPYKVSLGEIESGEHLLEITCFGSRINTFGQVHNCNDTEPWYGPNSWRTTNEHWSYEYCLKPTGLLKAPVVVLEEDKA